MDTAVRADLAAKGIAPECIETIDLVRDVLARMGDKWTVLVISALAAGPLRFTALNEQVTGISQRMLSQTLRLLTKDGLVTRTAYAEVPPRVEYALTPLGHSLIGVLGSIVHWVREHQGEVIQNRTEFEAVNQRKVCPAGTRK